jgi:hypothetical protein
LRMKPLPVPESPVEGGVPSEVHPASATAVANAMRRRTHRRS